MLCLILEQLRKIKGYAVKTIAGKQKSDPGSRNAFIAAVAEISQCLKSLTMSTNTKIPCYNT